MGKQELISYWTKSGIVTNKLVLKAFKKIKRENFILKQYKSEAYGDYPLPIGYGQTISQPTTIMMMLETLELKSKDKVLEIGTGSGYSGAIIAEAINPGKIYTLEIIKELVEFSKANLKKTKLKNIEVIKADGSVGYKKNSPYNKIIVNAASKEIPEPLLKQLKLNGILVAPVGSGIFGQEMVKIKKTREGIKKENLGSFVFVKLRGRYGYRD